MRHVVWGKKLAGLTACQIGRRVGYVASEPLDPGPPIPRQPETPAQTPDEINFWVLFGRVCVSLVTFRKDPEQ